MATFPQPNTASAQNAQLGLNYINAARIRMELHEALDISGAGFAMLEGDLSNSGTTVTHLRRVGGLGGDTRMQSMPSETSTPVDATLTGGFDTCSLGQYGLKTGETFVGRITADEATRNATGIEAFKAGVAGTFASTFRYNVALTGSGITASVGSAAADTSVDDFLSAVASFNTTAGALNDGAPVAMLDLSQAQDVMDSARTDPAFQNSLADFARVGGIRGQVIENFLGLGVDVYATADVQQSGGAYQGFMVQRGAIGWVKASTSPLRLPNAMNAVYIDDFGVVVFDLMDGANQQVLKGVMIAYNGYCLGDSSVYHQTRILGKV